jgi:NAD(P)-dependent dehydrogenase (short-subunit alcohol dehydrogenase family)
MQLRDKVALITGGNSGIGKETAILFAREGATVVIAARNPDKGRQVVAEIEALGGTALFVQCDVRSASDCQRSVDITLERFGRLDVLVNNAGVVLAGRAEDTDEVTWDEVMGINAKGVFLMCRAAIPVMRAQGGGVIVNNASDSGIVGERRLVAYCASKGAVVLMTKAMAVDHATEGIRVNALCPGPVYVDRWDRRAAAGGYDVSVDLARFISDVPMKRVGSPDEVARVALFLASDASSFMTGAAILVDGGRTAQ